MKHTDCSFIIVIVLIEKTRAFPPLFVSFVSFCYFPVEHHVVVASSIFIFTVSNDL